MDKIKGVKCEWKCELYAIKDYSDSFLEFFLIIQISRAEGLSGVQRNYNEFATFKTFYSRIGSIDGVPYTSATNKTQALIKSCYKFNYKGAIVHPAVYITA